MARKYAKIADRGVSGLGVVFDTTTRTVMAQDGPNDGIHQKVAAVKEVVTGRNKHEITLVLQHFDNDVQSTIQAFLDNGAKDILQEWQSMASSGNKPANKKKKKNRNRDKPPSATAAPQGGSTADAQTDSGTLPRQPQDGGTGQPLPQRVVNERQRGKPIADVDESAQNSSGVNKAIDYQAPVITAPSKPTPSHPASNSITAKTYHAALQVPSTLDSASSLRTSSTLTAKTVLSNSVANGNLNSRQTVNSSSRISASSTTNQKHSGIGGTEGGGGKISEVAMAPQNRGQQKGKGRPQHLDMSKAHRDRTISEASTSSISIDKSKKPHAGLEKSSKDLTRQTMSLNRQKMLLDDHVDQARKQISMSYAEAIELLKDREVSHLFQLNKVKNEAHEILEKRQQQGMTLKNQLDRAPRMNDLELKELRAEIKHFVSERKIDEDLGSTKRFSCDLAHLKEEIEKFGEVVGVKASYSTRRPSISSVTSGSVSHDDVLSPLSPPYPLSHPPSASATPLMPMSVIAPAPATVAAPAKAPAPVISGAKVISQSESVTQYESSELGQKRSKDTRPPMRGPRPSQSPRRRQGQGYSGQGQGRQGQGRQGQGQRPEENGVRGHKGHGDVANKAENDDDETDQKKSRSARRRQKLRERNREQKNAQEGNPPGETYPSQGQSQGQPDKKESPRSPQNRPQPRPRNRRTPSPKKRLQASEGQQEVNKEDQRSQGQGSQSPRQRRPRSHSNRSRGQATEQKSPKSSEELAEVSEASEPSKAVAVSVGQPDEEGKTEIPTEMESSKVGSVESKEPAQTAVEAVVGSEGVQVNGDSAEKSDTASTEKDINENNASKRIEVPIVNGNSSDGEKVAKTATVSIVPPKAEVTKATISINSEEALPQRKARPIRRRDAKGVSIDGVTSTNGIGGRSEEDEPGYPIVNGDINGTVNGELNGHESP